MTMTYSAEPMISKHHSNTTENSTDDNDTGFNATSWRSCRQTESSSFLINRHSPPSSSLSILTTNQETDLSRSNGWNKKELYKKAQAKHPLSDEFLEEIFGDLDDDETDDFQLVQ